MTEAAKRLLVALAWVCRQYMSDKSGVVLNHQFMSAGEMAVELLAHYGLVKCEGAHATWTKEGEELLDSN